MTGNDEFNYIVVFKDDHRKPALIRATKAAVLVWLSEQADPDQYDVYVGSKNKYVSGATFLEQEKTGDLVEWDYQPNPDTEVLAPNGADLENGMTILLAEKENRWDLAAVRKSNDAHVIENAHITNKWCTISQVNVASGTVSFLATYSDGFTQVRKYPVTTMWLVKTDLAKAVKEARTQELSDILSFVAKFMPKFYRMNPETDDLLPDGRHLANGMIVLEESPNNRQDVNELNEDWQVDRALRNNRWATVTNLNFDVDPFTFVAVYDDGTKHVRKNSIREGWLVKTDSISDAMILKTKRYEDVLTLVKAALHRQDMATQGGDTSRNMDVLAEELTQQLLGFL